MVFENGVKNIQNIWRAYGIDFSVIARTYYMYCITRASIQEIETFQRAVHCFVNQGVTIFPRIMSGDNKFYGIFRWRNNSRGDNIDQKNVLTRDTILGMPCFEAMIIGVAISQTWDLMISWSDD